MRCLPFARAVLAIALATGCSAPPQPSEAPAAPPQIVAAAAVPPRPNAAAHATLESTEPPAETHLPLDVLLRVPAGASRPLPPLESREPEAEPPAASPPPGVFDAWKNRVRVEQHTEATGHAGPKQGSVSQTDAGVRIPVDASVSLEGGVRVEQREDADAEAPVRKSIPRVGVEVRF